MSKNIIDKTRKPTQLSKSMEHLENYNKNLVDIKAYNEFINREVLKDILQDENTLVKGFGGILVRCFYKFVRFDKENSKSIRKMLERKDINFNDLYERMEIDDQRQALDLYAICSLVGDWLKYKQIYKFDVDTMEMLRDTKQEITNEVLENLKLPVDCFFIENDFELGGGCDTILVKQRKKENGFEYDFYGFGKEDKENFLHELKMYKSELGEFEEQMTKCNKDVENFYRLVFNLLMYLAQPKVEILKKSSGIKERNNAKSFYNVNYDENEVGYKLGNAIRTYRYKYLSESANHKTGGVKKPHLRSGHFHHYWCGKGRTDLIVKYVEPTFVKGGSKNATIHNVK